MYDQLNLKAWPFLTVPDGEFAKVWAGRRRTKEQVDQVEFRQEAKKFALGWMKTAPSRRRLRCSTATSPSSNIRCGRS